MTRSPIRENGCAGRRTSLEAWCQEMRKSIAGIRERLEADLEEMERYLRLAAPMDATREKAICECTRMVATSAETLYSLTEIFVRWSKQPAPDSAWDAALAAKTDALLEAAANVVATEPYRTNCLERFSYVREKWPHWCPAFDHERAAAV